MRQLCNVAYEMLAENRDEDELALFDRELVAPPGKRVSRGTEGLMAAFGMAQR